MKQTVFIVSTAALIGLAVSSANSAPIGRTGLSVPYSQFGARGACDKQKGVQLHKGGGTFTPRSSVWLCPSSLSLAR